MIRPSLPALALLCAATALPQPSVLSERYGNSRNGANLSETTLNTSNVNVSQFGKLFTLTVDGSTQAQPLYVPGVTVPGKGTHNVLYVATMNNNLYAFDADTNQTPLWTRNFGPPVPITDITGSNFLNIVGNVGIESTPVIDAASGTMFLVARNVQNGVFTQSLHAVDISSGAERPNSPATLQGSFGGVTFDPFIHNQRTSLAIANGKVLIAWASHEDLHAYHGWVMAYNTATLTQAGIFCTTTTGTLGGIWQSGWAPAIDASGNAYYISGNGTWDGTANFGESILKFNTGSGLSLVDWFTPSNFQALNNSDLDLGSSGAMLIPGTNLVVGAGKTSVFYVVRTNNLGHLGDGSAVQLLSVNGGEIKGGPVYWARTNAGGPEMYVWAANDRLKAFHFNGSTFDTTPVSEGNVQAPAGTSPGVLTLSANGSTAGTGIVWASIPQNQNADHGVVTGMLRAFDANNLSNELWNSRINAGRDDTGTWPKWSPPLVINGKVYLGSFSNQVSVFGRIASTGGGIPTGVPLQVINQNSGFCLDVVGVSKAVGAVIDQWPCNGQSNQKWIFTALGGGQFEVVSQNSSLAMEVKGASTADLAAIDQFTFNNANNQKWSATAIGGFFEFTALNSGKCLDVPGQSKIAGTAVIQFTCNGGANQLWRVQ